MIPEMHPESSPVTFPQDIVYAHNFCNNLQPNGLTFKVTVILHLNELQLTNVMKHIFSAKWAPFFGNQGPPSSIFGSITVSLTVTFDITQ